MAEVIVPQTTKISAEDPDGATQPLKTSGTEGDLLKVTAEHGYLLHEILTELRINNAYLRIIVGSDSTVRESDIEIGDQK